MLVSMSMIVNIKMRLRPPLDDVVSVTGLGCYLGMVYYEPASFGGDMRPHC